MTAIQFSQPGQLKALPPLSLYIHLPWCVQKCPYCDFNSHTAKAENDQERYVDALLADLASELPHVWGRPVETIFIGGGTPSLFSAASINRLLAGVRALVRVQPAAEITLEANPGTFEREKFEGFRDAGITRLSIGVQSFNDACLKKLGRIHNSGEALAAIETALHLFERVNIDLMYALPGQDVAGALADVQTSLATGVSHISAYHLTMEPNTPFGHTRRLTCLPTKQRKTLKMRCNKRCKRPVSFITKPRRLPKTAISAATTSITGSLATTSASARARTARFRITTASNAPYANATPTIICKPSPPIPPRLPSAAW